MAFAGRHPQRVKDAIAEAAVTEGWTAPRIHRALVAGTLRPGLEAYRDMPAATVSTNVSEARRRAAAQRDGASDVGLLLVDAAERLARMAARKVSTLERRERATDSTAIRDAARGLREATAAYRDAKSTSSGRAKPGPDTDARVGLVEQLADE